VTTIVQQSANEMIERLGPNAVEYLNDRIDQMLGDGMSRNVDQAYLLLNEVERLLDAERV